MQARRIKRAAIVAPIALILTLATVGMTSEPGAGREQTQTGAAQWSLNHLILANVHLRYLYLDEVVAGRGGLMTPEVYLARAHLEYLLLPEVMHLYSWLADAH